MWLGDGGMPVWVILFGAAPFWREPLRNPSTECCASNKPMGEGFGAHSAEGRRQPVDWNVPKRVKGVENSPLQNGMRPVAVAASDCAVEEGASVTHGNGGRGETDTIYTLLPARKPRKWQCRG